MKLHCPLVKITKANSSVSPEAQQEAQKIQQVFVPSQLDDKFNRLEKDYGILCEMEDSVISLGFIMQALMQQGGVLKKPQVDKNGELVLELKAVASSPVARWNAAHRTGVEDLRPGDEIACVNGVACTRSNKTDVVAAMRGNVVRLHVRRALDASPTPPLPPCASSGMKASASGSDSASAWAPAAAPRSAAGSPRCRGCAADPRRYRRFRFR